ncbi:transcriptional regulator [Savagea sp. SN6]|uniref:Transcriptional regulator n=1 Tax=Savagea serpentis TaxID=2785297 RepID=A0A8J7GLM9_9BACL|nr:transcriptional regulator [Savagea serpentis]MBF4501173.1 transcriptional regulator [Savagea serpentis]
MRERDNRKNDLRKVIVEIPTKMLNEKEQVVNHREASHKNFVYISADHSELEDIEHLREIMMKGYVEMSQINLKIATECLHVEYEAQHTMERLVSGG